MRLLWEAEGLELCAEGAPGGEKPRRLGSLSPGWVERGKEPEGLGARARAGSAPPLRGRGPWSCQEESPGEAALRGAEQPLRSSREWALRGREGQARVLCVSRRSGLPGHPEEQQGAFPSGQEPKEARAFSESERSGRGARPRRGPGERPRRLRLGAVSSLGRRAAPVPAAPRAGGLPGGSVAGK